MPGRPAGFDIPTRCGVSGNCLVFSIARRMYLTWIAASRCTHRSAIYCPRPEILQARALWTAAGRGRLGDNPAKPLAQPAHLARDPERRRADAVHFLMEHSDFKFPPFSMNGETEEETS